METAIQVFNNPQFGDIRTLAKENGETFFVGKDVAKALGYSDPQKAIKMHVDSEDKLTRQIVVSGQKRNVIFIDESGLYSLILSSKLPQAKQFKRWVTSEVLPAIRRTGAYAVPNPAVTDSTEHLLAELRDSRTQDADKLLRRQVTAFNKRLKEYTSDGRYFLGAGYGPASREQSGIVLAPGLTFEQSLKSLFGQLDEAFLMFFSRNYGIAKGETALQLRMEAMRNQIALLGKMAGVL
ncbi:MAG: Bro-N domain-containing protein [Bacteroidaceae bacterium]|nr:Bro-N domain-containing protein [Bacteroidaceae bacterium]